MTKKIIWIAILAVIIGGVWWTNQPKPSSTTEPIKIGAATILSGDFAAGGENIINTLRLAIEEVNSAGGINGRSLTLITEDAKCDSKTGLAAAQKLVNVDRVKYFIDGMCSNGLLAAAPLLNEQQVITLRSTTGGKNIDEAGEYIFRVGHSDRLAGAILAEAMNKLSYKTVGVITEVTEYTLDISETFQERFTALGGQIVFRDSFQPAITDFRTTILKVKAQEVPALLILSQTGMNAAHFIKQARELSLNSSIFSDFTLVTNNNAQQIVGSFEGIYFADPAYNAFDPRVQGLLQRYQDRFSISPLIPFHNVATYDALMILVDALRKFGDEPEKIHNWLKNLNNWSGLATDYTFDENGNSQLGFEVKMVKNGQFVQLGE